MTTRDEPWPPGTPCWIDYGAVDVAAAERLYTELFGWVYTGGDEESGGYVVCRLEGRDAAGLSPLLDPTAPPSWNTWFASDDVEAAADRVTEAGGSVVVAPIDLGPLGRMAFALDPQGNGFGIWQSGVNTGVRIANVPGSWTWTDGMTEDPESARTFYTEVFHFSWERMEGAEDYATFGLPTSPYPLGGLGLLPDGMPKGWTTCFAVRSAQDAVDAVTRAGGTLLLGPLDSPFGQYAVLRDPWGAALSVMARTDSSGEQASTSTPGGSRPAGAPSEGPENAPR